MLGLCSPVRANVICFVDEKRERNADSYARGTQQYVILLNTSYNVVMYSTVVQMY